MNQGLQECDALMLVPVYYAISIILQLGTSAVFFDELSKLSGFQWVGLLLGLALTLFGVFQLGLRSIADPEGDNAAITLHDAAVEGRTEGRAEGRGGSRSITLSDWDGGEGEGEGEEDPLEGGARGASQSQGQAAYRRSMFRRTSSVFLEDLPRTRVYSMAPEAYPESTGVRQGRRRTYSVAVIGLGVS